jgi:hypothetical protein
MLNLEPLINRLVNDVLRAIRGASLAELRAVLGSPGGEVEPQPRAPNSPRLPRTSAKRGRVRPSDLGVGAVDSLRLAAEPEPHSEITDPERLLLASAARPLPEPVEAPAAESASMASTSTDTVSTEPEEAPPSGAVARPVVAMAATSRLRDGESLASTPGMAVVIRRAKKS